MVTPEAAVEAVEAAARAICVAHGEWTACEWDEGIARERMKSKYRKQARAALEAAAPHMLAEVWDDGATDGHLYGIKATNPYRTTK